MAPGIMKRNIIISIDSDTHELTTPEVIEAEVADKEDETINKGTPLQTDKWIYRIVVGALALTLLSSLTGAVYLQAKGEQIPNILTCLGSGAFGWLGC
jgi:hypothetical protein